MTYQSEYEARFKLITAAFILAVWFIVMALISGCMTTYDIQKTNTDGSSVTVMVKSYREFEQPDISFSRKGDDVDFNFGATAATTGVSPIEQAIAAGIVSGSLRFIGPVPDGDEQ